MGLPDFLVLGAAKSGTTSLYHYLRQHPDIFMSPRKEPSFFAHEGQTTDFKGPGDEEWTFVTDISAYQRLFADAPNGAKRGDVSPRYLFFEQAHRRIAHHIPDARLVAILRHPVDRAYSHFLMNRRRGCEPEPTLRRAIRRERQRATWGWGWDWSYVAAGRYYEQLSRYYDLFPKEQIMIFLYDDLKNDSSTLFRKLFRFLEVDESFQPNTSRQHRSAFVPRSYTLQSLLRPEGSIMSLTKQMLNGRIANRMNEKLTILNAAPPPPLSEDERESLFEQYFADDCMRLESLVHRDLTSWTSSLQTC